MAVNKTWSKNRQVHRRLHQGHQGLDVAQIQHALNARAASRKKYGAKVLKATGKFDRATAVQWDLECTAIGLSHDKCTEGNQRLMRDPSKRTAAMKAKERAWTRAAKAELAREKAGTLGERALRVARSLVGVMEQGGNNAGPMVSKIIRENGGAPGEAWCFAAGTLVNTPDGLRRIESLRDGDEVLTASGAPSPVVTREPRLAETVRLRALGVADTVTSEDHPYLVRRNHGRLGHLAFGEPEWATASGLRKGDLIRLPSLDGGDELFNTSVAYVFGRFLADGWTVTKPQRIVHRHRAAFVCCAHGETEDLRERLIEADMLGAERRYDTVTQFGLPVRAAPFFEAGAKAMTKRVPGRALRWDRAARMALLDGYLDGDGHEYQPGRWTANTVSRELAYGMAQVARSLGRQAAVYAYERDAEAMIDGRVIRQSPVRYEMKFTEPGPQCRGEWHPVRSVEPAGRCEVFNLSVRDEQTFIADGAAVHNCGDFDAYCYRHAGSKVVQRAWAAVRSLGFLTGMTKTKSPKAGDIVCFAFDHTGLFIRDAGGGYVYTVEGNTGASGAVSDSETGGDGVYLKKRSKSLVARYVRVSR